MASDTKNVSNGVEEYECHVVYKGPNTVHFAAAKDAGIVFRKAVISWGQTRAHRPFPIIRGVVINRLDSEKFREAYLKRYAVYQVELEEASERLKRIFPRFESVQSVQLVELVRKNSKLTDYELKNKVVDAHLQSDPYFSGPANAGKRIMQSAFIIDLWSTPKQ